MDDSRDPGVSVVYALLSKRFNPSVSRLENPSLGSAKRCIYRNPGLQRQGQMYTFSARGLKKKFMTNVADKHSPLSAKFF